MSRPIRFRLAVMAAALVLMGLAAIWMRPFGLGLGLAYAVLPEDLFLSLEAALEKL